MRILQVAFKNINSLSGEHEIDFTKEPFSYSSLYAITGTTGSGKSSILDAISLALYNVTPRMGRISHASVDTAGAILTRGQKEAYTKVTYACKAGVFRSEWHISTARTGNLRDYEMMLYDIENDQALDYNKGMIPKANEERIGLSYEQFNKSVMLAQGEFAEFLKAPKKDRGDLLEKITGSAIYRKIGIAVFQKFKEQEVKTKDLNLILTSKKEAQSPKEEIATKQAASLSLQKQLVGLEKQVENIREQNRRIEEILKKELELEQTKQSLLDANKALAHFISEDGKPWQEHKKILPHLSELQAWEQAAANIKKLQDQKLFLKEEKESLGAECEQIIAKISEIIQESTDVDTAISMLQAFHTKYENIDIQRTELGSKFREQAATADALIKSLGSVHSFNSSSTDFAKDVASVKESLQNQYKLLLAQIKTEDAALTQLVVDTQETQLKNLRQAQVLANEIQNIFKREQETSQSILGLEKSLLELESQEESLKTNAELNQLKYEKLELQKQNVLLTQSLEKHRINLKPGESCPLCGALEHPFAVQAPSLVSDIDTALKEIKQQADTSKALFLKNLNHRENLTTQIARDKQIHTALSTNLAGVRNNFNENFQEITNTPETYNFQEAISLKESIHKTLLKALDTKKTLASLNDLLPIAQQMSELVVEGKSLKAQQENLYKGTDFKQVSQSLREALQKNRNSWDIKLKQEKNLLEELKTSQEAFKVSSLTLETNLKQKEIESIEVALSIRLQDAVYIALENKHTNIQSALQKANTQQDLQHKELISLKDGVAIENKEEVQTNLTKQLEGLTKLREEEKQLVIFLSTQLQLQTDIASLEKQIKAITKDAKPLIILQKMIGDAKGARFNDYAQDMTLAYLLQLANKRLDGLNKRYKVDKPSKTEGDNLMVIDSDMGNQRRAIHTLSGGETFMLSLALALALSDLAAKNVQIESMFIDEGFGTLDPEALDQTLDALERLQMESSKLIGIISHVDSLKERISTQIQLTQDGKGYSKMNIVG